MKNMKMQVNNCTDPNYCYFSFYCNFYPTYIGLWTNKNFRTQFNNLIAQYQITYEWFLYNFKVMKLCYNLSLTLHKYQPRTQSVQALKFKKRNSFVIQHHAFLFCHFFLHNINLYYTNIGDTGRLKNLN